MNIHKLTLAGFGSYLEPQTIEFDKFGTNSLFLITGPTGGGKTTILNAITYALYGYKNDGDKDVRTAHANPEHATFVEMDFEVSGKNYRVKRSPAYLGLRKKGKGRTAQQSPDLEFYELLTKDGSVVESNLAQQKITETQELINEKVGRNFKQFMMTSMMRQNGFVELLNSSSSERTEIFQTLFNTENYGKVQEKFKAAFDEAKAEYDKTKENVVKEFNKIRVTGNLELSEKLAEYRKINYENKIVETTELLDNIIAYDRQEAFKTAEALQDNNRQIGELQAIAGNKLKVDEIKSSLPLLQENIAGLQTQLTSAQEQYVEAKLQYDTTYEPTVAEKAELKAKIEVFAEITKQINAAAAAADAGAKAAQEAGILEQRIANGESMVQELADLMETKKDVPVEKARLTSAKELTEAEAKAVSKKVTEILELKITKEKLVAQLDKLKQELTEAELNVETNVQAVAQAQKAQFSYQALQLDIQRLQQEIVVTRQLLQLITDYELEQKHILELHQKYQEAKSRVQEQSHKVTDMEEALLQQKGFAIARQLKEGDICPVCGNHYVPGKVQFTAGEVTEATLNQARGCKEKLEQEEKLAYDELQDKSSRNSSRGEAIKNQGKVVFGEGAVETVKAKAESEYRLKYARLQGLENQAKSLKNMADNLEKLHEAQKKAEEDLKKLQENRNLIVNKLSTNAGLTKSALDSLKQDMFAFKTSDEKINERLTISLATVGAGEESVAQGGKDFAEILEEYAKTLSAAIKDCDVQIIEIDRAKRNMVVYSRELEKLRQEHATKRLTVVQKETAEKSAKEQIKALKQKVDGLSEQELKNTVMVLENKTQALKNVLALADKNVEQLRKQLGDKEKQLTGLEQQLQALTDNGKVDFAAASAKLDSLTAQQPGLKQTSELFAAELNVNKAVMAETKGKGKVIAAQEKRKAILERLKKVARGEVTDYKIPLETHVQGYYMDKVVEEARSFLRNVSGGRYELVRRKSESNSSKTGLDLNVIDIQNGCSERSVGSLSGGESFSGALSLLIALSNVVQSFNGGAENNIIFVDEGFGSLDERFLDRVIAAQNALSNNNRSIGIISHRPELEESISLKLVVKPEEVEGYLTSKIGYEGV